MDRPYGYWKTQTSKIKEMYDKFGARYVMNHYNISYNSLQSANRRYGLGLDLSKKVRLADLPERSAEVQEWIKRRNEVMLMRW